MRPSVGKEDGFDSLSATVNIHAFHDKQLTNLVIIQNKLSVVININTDYL